MNKTRQIVVDRRTFHIDEEAYQILSDYLKNLEKHYKSLSYGKEIVEDIEARISELFSPKSKDNQFVITAQIVKEVIATIGSPEDIDGDLDEKKEQASEPNQTPSSAPTASQRKRFFRDLEDKKLGGVCSGIAHYLNFDVAFVRIAAAVLVFVTFGYSVLVYLILWLLTPPARSTAQRLEMRGENVTITNIQASIEREFERLRQKFNKSK